MINEPIQHYGLIDRYKSLVPDDHDIHICYSWSTSSFHYFLFTNEDYLP